MFSREISGSFPLLLSNSRGRAPQRGWHGPAEAGRSYGAGPAETAVLHVRHAPSSSSGPRCSRQNVRLRHSSVHILRPRPAPAVEAVGLACLHAEPRRSVGRRFCLAGGPRLLLWGPRSCGSSPADPHSPRALGLAPSRDASRAGLTGTAGTPHGASPASARRLAATGVFSRQGPGPRGASEPAWGLSGQPRYHSAWARAPSLPPAGTGPLGRCPRGRHLAWVCRLQAQPRRVCWSLTR